MAGSAKAARVFREPDRDRLLGRLSGIVAGDLTSGEIARLADGDISLVEDLPFAAQQGVRVLVAEGSPAAGAMEKMVGVAIDFVPVAYLDLARMAANAVARVVDTNRRAIGTGTLVSPRLFLTNHHVTPDVEQAAQQILQFDYELEVEGTPRVPSEFRLDPAAFFWTSPEGELDATLVAVGAAVSEGRPLAEFGSCPFSGAGNKHAEGDFVTIVQHPDGDFKQVALRENHVIGRGKGGVTLHYGADTLPGSSGSPVFNDQFELVSLHHAGGPLNETTLEDGRPVPQDSNEGIRISALVTALRAFLDTSTGDARTLLAETLDPPANRPRLDFSTPKAHPAMAVETTRPAASAPVVSALQVLDARRSELTVPLRLTIGAAGPTSPGTQPAPDVGSFERNQAPDERYGRRRGYDADFLDVPVELPGLSDELLAAAVLPAGKERTEEGVRLKYLHFSTVQHAQRLMPIFTAVNIDGARARGINRETGEVEASEIWFLDPRITDTDQLQQPFFDRQRPRIFDRGHMVRRLDPAWGSAETARRASDDTFHFTNCAPQVSAFNQRAAMWAGIENYVLDNAKAENARVTVFTGPVFTADDPVYREVSIPRAFWKLLVRVEGGELRCTAFLADQGELLDAALAAGGVEGFDDLGKVAVFQNRVTQLATLTDLNLRNLASHDTLQLEGGEDVHLRTLEDIQW